MRTKTALVIFIFAIGFTACQQEKKEIKTNLKTSEIMEKQAIEILLNKYKESLNTSNASKATSLYNKEGVFMPSNAPTAIGKKQILVSYEYVFSQIQLSIEFFIEEITIENNIAFALTSSKGTTFVRAKEITIPEENRELFVFKKEEGQWKIARYMFNKTK